MPSKYCEHLMSSLRSFILSANYQVPLKKKTRIQSIVKVTIGKVSEKLMSWLLGEICNKSRNYKSE